MFLGEMSAETLCGLSTGEFMIVCTTDHGFAANKYWMFSLGQRQQPPSARGKVIEGVVAARAQQRAVGR